jgi:hypothetical protein
MLSGIPLTDIPTKAWLFITQQNKKTLWAVVTAFSILLGLCWIAFTPTSYQASAVLGAVEDNNKGASVGGGIGAISQSLGIAISPNNLSQGFGRFQELLNSTYLVGLVDEKYHIADTLGLPHDGAPVGFSFRNAIKSMLGMPTTPTPRFEQLLGVIHGALTITPELQTQTIEVTFTARTPKLAQRLLLIFITEADNVLKQRAKIRSSKEIDYLTNQLRTINGQVLREALYPSVVQSEENLLMSSNELPYSVEILDAPFASSKPDWPRPTWQLLVMVTIFQVLFFSMIGYKYLLPDNSIFEKDEPGADA